jgi:hypothetical protein
MLENTSRYTISLTRLKPLPLPTSNSPSPSSESLTNSYSSQELLDSTNTAEATQTHVFHTTETSNTFLRDENND